MRSQTVTGEAELPPNYDRVGIENFIRAKYEEKRWIPKDDGKAKSPVRGGEEKASVGLQRPSDGHGSSRKSSPEKFQTQGQHPRAGVRLPVPPKGREPIAPAPAPQQVIQKTEPVRHPEPTKQVTDIASPPKVDCATDLFNMLSMDGSGENASADASADDF